jgi:hypothetical protein
MRRAIIVAALLFVLAPGSAHAAPGSCADPAGVYATDFNEMHLNASGATGYYAWDQGRITGSFANGILTGRWSEAPTYAGPYDAGSFELAFSDDCSSFTGKWKHDADAAFGGTWTGTRTSAAPATPTLATPSVATPLAATPTGPTPGDEGTTPSPTPAPAAPSPAAACDMTGDWTTTKGKLVLNQTGDSFYTDSTTASGPVKYAEGSFHGRSVQGALGFQNDTSGPRGMTMSLAPDCDSFTGTITVPGNAPIAWSGTRDVRAQENALPGPGVALALACLGALALARRRR